MDFYQEARSRARRAHGCKLDKKDTLVVALVLCIWFNMKQFDRLHTELMVLMKRLG